jgi:hypothetical protein
MQVCAFPQASVSLAVSRRRKPQALQAQPKLALRASAALLDPSDYRELRKMDRAVMRVLRTQVPH